MTIRALAAVLSLAALAPLAAHADAPSGDFHVLFPATSKPGMTVPSDRAEHRNYMEFTVDQLIGQRAGPTPTVADVRRAIAAAPLPMIGA